MRIMTGHARLARIMLCRENLWKSGWPRRIITVAERTISSAARGEQKILIRFVYMGSTRSMTGFT
jgi:hypothetical protein